MKEKLSKQTDKLNFVEVHSLEFENLQKHTIDYLKSLFVQKIDNEAGKNPFEPPKVKPQKLKILNDQKKKGLSVMNHYFFKKDVNLARLRLGVPEEGFPSDDKVLDYLESENSEGFDTELKALLKKYNSSERWFEVYAFYILLNRTNFPHSWLPEPIEYYVASSRDRLVISIFKSTTLNDIKKYWNEIAANQQTLKPNNVTQSDKGFELMAMNDRGAFEMVTAHPARRTKLLSVLYKRGEDIYIQRDNGIADKEIARGLRSKKKLTAKDVADLAYDYKNIIDQIHLD